MNKKEYREARKKLGYTVSEWIAKLEMSRSTHDKYTSGRNRISPWIAQNVRRMLSDEGIELEAGK